MIRYYGVTLNMIFKTKTMHLHVFFYLNIIDKFQKISGLVYGNITTKTIYHC
jgi:hypothetical protein